MIPRWHDVGPRDDVSGPPWPSADVDGHEIRLLVVGDAVVAIDDVCPHQQAPLAMAEVAGDMIECPRHWYGFDAATGTNVVPGRDDCGLVVHRARVVDGRVEVWR